MHGYLGTLIAGADAHREPRTLALRRAALLIIEGEHRDAAEVLERTHRDMWDAIGHIGGGLTVFSPWQKRNVPLDVFELEIGTYYERTRGS